MTRWIYLVFVLGMLGGCSPGQPEKPVPRPSPRADALDLLVLGEKVERLQLRVEIGGLSVPAVWDETFARLLAYFDRDGDGSLSRTEAGRLPSAFALRQVLWGQFHASVGDAPPFADLDLDGDGKASGEELADYYRRAGLGGVLVGVGRTPASDKLTDALLKHLDANKDGKVDEAEGKAAAQVLLKLDKNDDELVGPGELVEKTAYPGASGSNWLEAPSPGGKPNTTLDALPLIVLPLRTSDTSWPSVVAARREKAKAPAIKPASLAALREDATAATWVVRLGTRAKDAARLQAGGVAPANARLVYATTGMNLELRADDGKLKEQTAASRRRFVALFAESDTNSDGMLDEKELGTPKAWPFKQLLADRDGDGNLSEKEFGAWFDLQEQVARGQVLLTVIDHGCGLFEFLDADHDGSLAVRELRTSWERLKAAGYVTDNVCDRAKLPRQLLAVVSHGHPVAPVGTPVRPGPAWFLGMDRNGDGDVSAREWVGELDVFRKWDADGDLLLSAEEAAKAPAKR